jgi:polar amino acid transport system substrate-binding protein
MKLAPALMRFLAAPRSIRVLVAALICLVRAGFAFAEDAPLRVAVYDAPPYGHVEPDGSIDGVSVDLWRRAAESLKREYRLVPVAQMEDILKGLERRDYDAAIGAITITPARLARVDFSYPTHRSGVAVAVRQDVGPMAALASYGAVLGELAPLIALTFALLVVMGVAMWLAERQMRPHNHESVVDTLRDGFYWAVVTMTTVGYGDKTPKTTAGRLIAVVWMLASVALISILSTSIVSRMTAERVVGGLQTTEADLAGKRLGAVAHSSGAEYLDERQLRYASFNDLAAALAALSGGQVDAVVNSIGALQYLIAARFKEKIRPPQGVLEPAYMAVALPPGSPLKKPLDEVLVGITAGEEWRRIEDSYFGWRR